VQVEALPTGSASGTAAPSRTWGRSQTLSQVRILPLAVYEWPCQCATDTWQPGWECAPLGGTGSASGLSESLAGPGPGATGTRGHSALAPCQWLALSATGWPQWRCQWHTHTAKAMPVPGPQSPVENFNLPRPLPVAVNSAPSQAASS